MRVKTAAGTPVPARAFRAFRGGRRDRGLPGRAAWAGVYKARPGAHLAAELWHRAHRTHLRPASSFSTSSSEIACMAARRDAEQSAPSWHADLSSSLPMEEPPSTPPTEGFSWLPSSQGASQATPQAAAQLPAQARAPALPPRSTGYTYGQYFQDKRENQYKEDQKLRDRYLALDPGLEKRQIFKGLSIYVNGLTDPGRMQLHHIVVQHGGHFVHYLSKKSDATHIVASNLTLRKRVEFQNYKVVTPNWLTESVNHNKLLPWQEFQLYKPKNCFFDRQTEIPNPPQQRSTITNCKDPNFIESYFANSRLHHLSEWKSKLRKEFLLDVPVSPIDIGSGLTILHIDFDCFFATVAYLVHSDEFPDCKFDRDPVVVCHGGDNSEIASCNYVARSYGISNGMWVQSAKKLLPNNKTLYQLPYNFEAFQSKSEIFYRCLDELQIFQLIIPISIDEAICVMNDNEGIDLDVLSSHIRQQVHNRTGGCTVSIGCSNTLVMARLLLKLAKPDGYKIMRNDVNLIDHSFWSNFKVSDLPGFGKSIISKLNKEYGKIIINLQELIDLKPSSAYLQTILGQKVGSKLFLYLQGKDDEDSLKMIVDPSEYLARKSLSIEINWGIRFDDINEIDDFLFRCCKYIIGKLKSINKLTSQVTMKIMRRSPNAPVEPLKRLGMGKCDSFNTSSKLGIPTDEVGLIFTEVKTLYRSIGCPAKELRGVSIQFNKLHDDISRQQQLLPFMSKQITAQNGNMGLPRKESFIFQSTFEANFVKELPSSLAEELKRQKIIDQKIQNSKVDKLKNKILKNSAVSTKWDSHFIGGNSIFEPVKFQTLFSFKEISILIKRWIQNTLRNKGPNHKDLRLFERYLQKLCDSNRVYLALDLINLVSKELTLQKLQIQSENGFTEWEKFLLKRLIPILNRSRQGLEKKYHTLVDFDIS